ncbi:protein required for normal CLN1 and CLN2 G1 cyclin expression, partial [Clydaea vesicula]
ASIFATYAVNNHKFKKIQAEALSIKGKIHHINNEYDEALKCLESSLALNPASLAVHFGLGQLYTYQGDFDKAIESFQFILQKEPNNYETLKNLAFLNSKKASTKGAALEDFKKLNLIMKTFEKSDKVGGDPEVLVEYGRLKEETDIKEALEAYLQAKAILENSEDGCSAELYNNIGALYHIEGNIEEAKKYYTLCLNKTTSGDHTNTSVLYNLGRLHEDKAETKEAEDLYKLIQTKHPAYVDAQLRLGVMIMEKGNMNSAEDFFRDVHVMDSKNIESFLLLGKCQQLGKQYKLARSSFVKVLQEIDSHDLYALCSVGNLNLKFARTDPLQKDLHYKRAFEFFDKCLKIDSQNYCAALGVAICLAENSRFTEAKEIFSTLRGVTLDIPAATVNLGHIFIELGQARDAVNLYEHASKKYYENKDSYVLHCISRAYYIIAKSERDEESMKKSLRYIQLAARINPSDLSLFYDIALIKQQYAHVLNDQTIDKRPLLKLLKAAEGLETSRKLFAGLSEIPPSSYLGYDVNHARERGNYCKDVKRATDKKIHETEVLERMNKERMEALIEEQKKLEEQKKKIEELKREEEERKQNEIEMKRRELKQKMQEEHERMSMYEREMEKEEREKKPKKKEKRLGGSDEDSDNATDRKKRKLSKKIIDDEDDI